MRKVGRGDRRSFLCGMMCLVFSGIDPEVILMSVLLDAGLLRFKEGFGSFFSAVGGGRERELWGC